MDIDPNAILVFLVMAASGLKALFDWWQEKKNPGSRTEDFEGEEDDFLEFPTPPAQAPVTPAPAPPREKGNLKSRLEAAKKDLKQRTERYLEQLDQSKVQPPAPEATTPPPPPPKPAPAKISRPNIEKPAVIAGTRSKVLRQLSSPTAAREALLLAEILGPPKGMQADPNERSI